MEEAINAWLSACELDAEQNILAVLVRRLAAEFDAKPHTSTAAELRKTYLELRASLKPTDLDFDPLREMMQR
jgi:hypothetical protein